MSHAEESEEGRLQTDEQIHAILLAVRDWNRVSSKKAGTGMERLKTDVIGVLARDTSVKSA